MLTSDTLYYPLKIEQHDSGLVCAYLIDLPDGPKGWGHNDKTAVQQLADKALPILNDLRTSGKPITPSPAGKQPALMVGPILAINSKPAAATGGDAFRASGDAVGYSWTDGKPRGTA